MPDGNERVLIWSFEHMAWWRPGRGGYTGNFEYAGYYDLEEAIEIVRCANIGEVKESIVVVPRWPPRGPLPMRVTRSDYE